MSGEKWGLSFLNEELVLYKVSFIGVSAVQLCFFCWMVLLVSVVVSFSRTPQVNFLLSYFLGCFQIISLICITFGSFHSVCGKEILISAPTFLFQPFFLFQGHLHNSLVNFFRHWRRLRNATPSANYFCIVHRLWFLLTCFCYIFSALNFKLLHVFPCLHRQPTTTMA